MDTDPDLVLQLKALASAPRLDLLGWLAAPRDHFPEQVDGDLVTDGVCAVFLADKLGVTQPTLHRHMQALLDARLVQAKRIKQWTFYRRDEVALARLVQRIGAEV